ncbi:MAG: hypothetical protein KZQ77_04955 [Candidatus Thiodiazotropha sp. (ex Notomyrtea botanica)]|nr:hypothetical protein [Candidatus Thiodiazotropha sp. (ex Notomyrtea botanica)]
MTVSISNVIEIVRTAIASCTDTNVALGAPVESKPGLYLYAYRLSETPFLRNTEATNNQSYSLHCLLLPHPPNNYGVLDDGLRCLKEQPILDADEEAVMITVSSLTTEELTQIFRSAAVAHRLAIPFELKWTVSR